MPYMKRICRAGKTMEIAKYYTYSLQPRGKKRAKKEKPTTEQQKQINDRQTALSLTRLLNANFDKDCWYITFSYAAQNRPKDIEELHRQEQKLLRSLRGIYKKAGAEFRYIWTAEVGKRGGAHIHMVVSPIDARLLKDVWGYGWVNIKPLDSSGQYRRIADYFMKYFQKTRGTDSQLQKKAYNPSKNLEHPRPVVKKMKGNRFSKEIRVPSGWYLDKESVREGATADGYEFLYYTLIKSSRKK